jgi:hypothetical protein
MNTIELLQDDGSVRTFRAPAGRWHSEVVGDVADPDALLRDAQCLGRGLAACEARLDTVRRHVPTMDDFVRLHHDAAGWLREKLPTEEAAMAHDVLARLTAALGPDGVVADAMDAGLPTPTLALRHAQERLADVEAEIARVTGAYVPRASGRRSS